jgi:hypothetical protein
MPPALKGLKEYENKEEMDIERKKRDNISQKIRYWRKRYGFDLKKEDYEDFNKNIHIIKKVYPIYDLIINFDKNHINPDLLSEYAKNWEKLNKGLEIKDYLKSLNKIEKKNEPIILVF